MAREIRTFEVVIPAGTLPELPQVTDLAFPPRVVTGLHIVVPPGPAGHVGFRVTASGGNVIPINPGEWIITDNEVIDWTLDGYHDSGAWQVTGYNTGQLDHTIYARFLLDLVTPAGPAAPTIIPATNLSSFTPADLQSLTGGVSVSAGG